MIQTDTNCCCYKHVVFFLSLGNTSTVHLATKTKTAHKKVTA